MTRPEVRPLLQVGRWTLARDAHGWIVRDGNGNVSWPSSLVAALEALYENIVVDNRFAQDTKNDVEALRNAILAANQAFENLLTPPKVAEIAEILRGGGPMTSLLPSGSCKTLPHQFFSFPQGFFPPEGKPPQKAERSRRRHVSWFILPKPPAPRKTLAGEVHLVVAPG